MNETGGMNDKNPRQNPKWFKVIDLVVKKFKNQFDLWYELQKCDHIGSGIAK